jgi:hypothetical protein
MKTLIACLFLFLFLFLFGCSTTALPAEKCTPAFQAAHAANCAALLDGQLHPDDIKLVCADVLEKLCPADRK